MPDIDKLVYQVADALENRTDTPDLAELLGLVKAYAAVLGVAEGSAYDATQIEDASRRVQTLFDIRMGIGALFEAEDYRPWLKDRQGSITPYYWNRYRNQLKAKGFSPHVVRTLDGVTDRILDHLENPLKEGSWARKGLVVGHVQSGKTANYTGVICKASDAGYRLIIVLAGTLNALRNQTQERIDGDFMGWCTKAKQYIGAARFGNERRPVCFTTSIEDFRRNVANSIALGLEALNEPVVLVLKKNKTTLENVYNWLLEHNRHNLKNFPMLLIDDEADHASINTNKDDKDPTAINRAIRDLLSLFPRSSFVGYTATPFANIFIDPENEDEMANGSVYKDLFPRDFILSLDPPDNYVGPSQLFAEGSTFNCIRTVDDHEHTLPLRHKIDDIPTDLPPSLCRAIDLFIVAKTIRLLRRQDRKHHSMMVNASRFTGVQNALKGLILEYVKTRRQAIANYAGLPVEEALQNSALRAIHEGWKTEYEDVGFDWGLIQGRLKEAVDPIEVISVNSDSVERLEYSEKNYPTGRSVIAVGGFGLSRGLTLEGLLVSYFLRNSIMYDTLMQMGRWFGYRDDYGDICRIFMTADAASWYAYIAEATEELRSDFRTMETTHLTPMEFGLRVRTHPAALIVTARNKMRAAHQVPVQIALEGRLAETSVILGTPEALAENRRLLETAVVEASRTTTPTWSEGLGWLWKDTPTSIVRAVVQGYLNHPECMLTYREPLLEYIGWLVNEQKAKIDMLLRSNRLDEDSIGFGGFKITPVTRTVASITETRIEFTKRRVASRGDEQAGLSPEEVARIKETCGTANIPDREYRKVKGRSPLLMLFIADVGLTKGKPDKQVPAYGMSFPGDSGARRRPAKLVEYQVNSVWWKNNMFIPGDEEDDET